VVERLVKMECEFPHREMGGKSSSTASPEYNRGAHALSMDLERLDSSSIANTISCSWIGNWGALGEYLEPLQCFAGSTASTLQTAHLLLEIHILLGRQDT